MADRWPDALAPFDSGSSDEADQQRWEKALQDALDAGTLRLERDGPHDNHAYDLIGRCPRCGHEMRDYLRFEIVRALREAAPPVVYVHCNCEKAHEGRPDDETGCGWAPGLGVTLAEPIEDES